MTVDLALGQPRSGRALSRPVDRPTRLTGAIQYCAKLHAGDQHQTVSGISISWFSRSQAGARCVTRSAREVAQETAEAARLCSKRCCHRQTQILRRCAAAVRILGAARARCARQQPGRKLAPAGATAGAQDARLQIGRFSSTFCRQRRRRPQHHQRSATPYPSRHLRRFRAEAHQAWNGATVPA